MKHLSIIFLLSICFSCKQNKIVSGRLKNLTSLESCTWIIELDEADKNGITKLEPSNLNAFQLKLKEGQRVKLRYKTLDLMSTCMAGKPAEIESIKESD